MDTSNTDGYPHRGYRRGYMADTGIIFIQRGGHGYYIYPMGRGRVSYYLYPWVPIDIPKLKELI